MRNRIGVAAVLAAVLGCSSGGGNGSAPSAGQDGGPDASASDGVGWPGASGRNAVGALGDAGPRSDGAQDVGSDAATGGEGVDGGAPSGDPDASDTIELPDGGTCDDPDHDGQCSDADPCPLDSFDDRDADGVCDDVDPCPVDKPDDSDADGVCNVDDHCVGAGAVDTDEDGACDGEDACAGHDDDQDDDDDSTPDGCDTCPIGSDADADDDGYADLCDQVLWSDGTSTTAAQPYTSIAVYLQAWETAALDTMLEEVTVSLPLSPDFEVEDASIEDLIAALGQSSQRRLRVGVIFNGGSTSPIDTVETPVHSSGAVWTRVVVHGSISGATRDFAVELRGYEP